MSGSGTIYTEQSVLGHTLGFRQMAFPAQVFVGLCSAAMPPSETVQGIEAFGGGYTRMLAQFALIDTPANIAANVATVEWPIATASWGTLGFFELWDAPAGGNRLYWGALIDIASQLPTTITVGSGDIVRFSAGTLAVQAATGAGGTSSVGAYLPLAGGTLLGPLMLAADPTTYLQAATKQYVDAHSGTGGGPGFLPLSGGTMLGVLTAPTLKVTTKQQVGSTGWLSSVIGGTEENSLFVSLSPIARSGGVFGTRTSDGNIAGNEAAWAIGGFVLQDNVAVHQGAWGAYLETRRYPNTDTVLGMEIATVNCGEVKQEAPYYMGQTGSSLGLWLSAGRADVTPNNPPSLAIGIIGNGVAFDRGIMFRSDSVNDTGPTGAVAIGLPFQYAMVWYLDDGGASTGAGVPSAIIRSDVTSVSGLVHPPAILFENSGVNIDPGAGANAAVFGPGLNTFQTTKVNNQFFVFDATGTTATIEMDGATGNIEMAGALSVGRINTPSLPVSVKDYGAKGDGTTNDAVAIQAAATAAAGGILLFPANATYLIGAPIYLSSDTTVMAHGAKIVPAPGIASLPGSSNPALGSSLGPVMFTNVNWQATTITDQNIRWFGGTLGPTTTRLACHGLFLRMVRNTHIADARFQLLNDCVAHLACVNTLVTGCMSSDFMNCAYDHWDGPQNATVRDCEARGGQSGVSTNGVLFNTDSTVTGHSSGTAATATIDNVRVYGCDQGVNAGPLIAGPTCNDVTVTNCYISGGTYGVYFSGVTGGRIAGNVVSGSLNPVLIGIVGDAAHPSSQIDITANRFENCAATQQYIQAAGPQMTVAHNRAVNCTSGGWALLIDDPSTVVMPNYLPGYNFAFLLNQHPYGGVTTPAMTVLADSTHNPGCTVSTGAAVPAATEPAGSIYMRTGGAAGARLYVSAGAGSWAAVAGV